MKVKSLIIGGIISVLIAIFLIVVIILIINMNNNYKQNTQEENLVEPEIEEAKTNTPLVIDLGEKEKVQETNKPKDAATLTQEIYDINGPIGTLNIPKTGLNTQIYSKVSAIQMEETPCFLYTTGGLNEVGTTIFVGHNRANGLLFSDNNMIEENDEFYFTDLNGVEKKYTVFSKFVTESDDVSFYNATVDSPIIAMQCCVSPTNEEQVIIIMGKSESGQ